MYVEPCRKTRAAIIYMSLVANGLSIHVIDISKACLLNISTERYIVIIKRHFIQ